MAVQEARQQRTGETLRIVPGELQNGCGCGLGACPHCVLDCRQDVAFDIVWHTMFEWLNSPARRLAPIWAVDMKLMAFGMIAARRYGHERSIALVNELRQLGCACPFGTCVTQCEYEPTSSSAAPAGKRRRTTTCPVPPVRPSYVSHTEHALGWQPIWDTVWPIEPFEGEWHSSLHSSDESSDEETHHRNYAEFVQKRSRASGSPDPPFYWCLNAGQTGQLGRRRWVWVSADINKHVERAWKHNWPETIFTIGRTSYTFTGTDADGFFLQRSALEKYEMRRFPIRRRFDC